MLPGDKDVFVSMPTGSGKSLIYQFPAVLKDRKFAIVICPLIALIQVRINEKVVLLVLTWIIYIIMGSTESESLEFRIS
jgi:hypothetical protein